MNVNELELLLSKKLPCISKQKRKEYKTNVVEITELYGILNKYIFDNKLILPEIVMLNKPKQYLGMCKAISFFPTDRDKSNCVLYIATNWICQQWLIMILAHEMCHQYQWDIDSFKRISEGKMPIISHGPSFFLYRDKLKSYNIALRRTYSLSVWYKTQNLSKV